MKVRDAGCCNTVPLATCTKQYEPLNVISSYTLSELCCMWYILMLYWTGRQTDRIQLYTVYTPLPNHLLPLQSNYLSLSLSLSLSFSFCTHNKVFLFRVKRSYFQVVCVFVIHLA